MGIASESELLKIMSCKKHGSYGSILCGNTILHNMDLLFYNDKWIYQYSICWRDNFEYPFVALCHIGTNKYKCFVINNEEDLKKFGNATLNEDNSIFNKDIKIEKHKCKEDDYQTVKNEFDNYVKTHNEVIWGSVGGFTSDDYFTVWVY